jgi:nucleoid-associated protein YgaU
MESNIKSLLKALKLNESTISMLLGLGVVIIIGGLVINYFKSKPAELPTLEDQEIALVDEATQEEFAEIPAEELPPFSGELPTSYQVRAGDNLWEIAERYYQTGYGWVEISQVNELGDPNIIIQEQELIIPQLAKAYPMTVEEREPAIGGASATSLMAEADEGEVAEDKETTVVTDPITSDTYVTVRGDHLWSIAVRAYNDGYQWVKLAESNKLTNPDLIHAGVELAIPR